MVTEVTEVSKMTYNDQACRITTLMASSAELITAINNLTDKILTLLEKLAAMSKKGGYSVAPLPGSKPTYPNKKGSAANSAGVFMTTRKTTTKNGNVM